MFNQSKMMSKLEPGDITFQVLQEGLAVNKKLNKIINIYVDNLDDDLSEDCKELLSCKILIKE